MRTSTAVRVGGVCGLLTVLLLFAANWYRRTVSSAPR
jgi:hypothetical protein